jgi:DNA modification methylase
MIIVAYRGEWNLGRGVLVEEDREDHRLLTHDEWLSWTNGVWSFSGVHREDHPAPFPEELPRRLIKLFSYPDAVVLDPFVGSGTSAAVSRDLGRTFYGFDHSPRYVQGARARVLGMSL